MSTKPYSARFWRPLPDGRLQCTLCPRDCKLKDGQRGHCFVRQRRGSGMALTTYGRSSGFCIDPIEKKPLNHFFPGSAVLSFGTAGCNLACKFCQNWDISKSRDFDRLTEQASPTDIVEAATHYKCQSVAFTYNDPVIFAEYAIDVANACRERGIHSVAVSAGYIHPEPRREFFSVMDAANIDLKSFDETFYRKITGSHLGPVLETLVYLKEETNVWFEITNLIIPEHNDSAAEIEQMSRWIADHLGLTVPIHFSAFHPDYKMRNVSPTPLASIVQAMEIAKQHGLKYVYSGNVHHHSGDQTLCPQCGHAVIQRDWYDVTDYHLSQSGHCNNCNHPIDGRFTKFTKGFGRKRLPIKLRNSG